MLRISGAVLLGLLALSVSIAHGEMPVLSAATLQAPIAPQALNTALQAWAQQSGVQVMYATQLATGLKSPGAPAGLPANEALKHLLVGTGLEYRILNDRTISVLPEGGKASLPVSLNENALLPGTGLGTDPNLIRLAQSDASQVGENKPSIESPGSQGPENQKAFTGTSQEAPGGKLEEIVVTAQKRNEREQDVPTSIQVLSGQALEAEGVAQLSDFAKQVPGLTFSGAHGPGQGQPVLRGIATGGDRGSLVGIYLDEVPFTPSSPLLLGVQFSFDPDLADIDHIEVLEGPQSTLYGASAMGGLIKFVTKQPDLHNVEGSVRVDGSQVDSGGDGYGVRGSVNIPLVPDTISIRASAFDRRDPGFVNNDFNGTKNINSDTVKGARLSVRAKITDNLETTLSGILQEIDNNGPDTVYLNPATLRPLSGNLSYTSPISQPTTIKYESVDDATTLNLNFATLTNIISDVNLRNSNFVDLSQYGGYIGMPAGEFISYVNDADSKRFSDEIRLASAPGKLEWLLGGFYTDERDSNPVIIRGTNSVGVFLAPSNPFYNVYTYLNLSYFKEKAVFGDLTYHLTDQISGTLGVRHSSNSQSFSTVTTGLLGVNNLSGSSTDSATNYLATVSYKPTSNATLYLRAASAYRPGGPNILNSIEIAAGVPTTFGSDSLWNYEGGIKGSGWDNRITYSADVYHMAWKDVQLQVLVSGFSAILNAASAKSDGAEASFQIVPLDGLTINLKGAYTDAKITSDVPTVGFANGEPLPYAPKVSAAALIDYRLMTSNGITPTVGLTYAYRDSETTQFINGISYRLPAYYTLDLRAGFDWAHYSLVARIDNVTNKFGLTDAGPNNAFAAPFAGVVIKPRTFGVSWVARF